MGEHRAYIYAYRLLFLCYKDTKKDNLNKSKDEGNW